MGTLEVITGPMFSGKTEALIRVVQRARAMQLPVQVFVPASDSRNGVGVVKSHGGVNLEQLGVTAWAVSPNDEVPLDLRVRTHTGVVVIDEAQFFPPSLVGQVRNLLRYDLRIVAAGLDRDFRDEPFGVMPYLLALATRVDKLTAICGKCKHDNATISHRIVDDTAQVLLGAADAYLPLCRPCYVKEAK